MQTILYLILALVVVFAAWWVLKVSLGIFLPLEHTARAYFVRLLGQMDISQVIPASCVDECVAESIRAVRLEAKLLGRDRNYIRAETVKQLEFRADMLRFWIRGGDNFSDSPWKSQYKAMFERHAVPRLGR